METLEIDKCINADCSQFMESMPSSMVDCVITSPPYGKQRATLYGGVDPSEYPEWIVSIGKQIHRILKPSGSFILNIKEHVENGVRHPYVFQSVLALSNVFKWNETFIWNKSNPFPTGAQNRLKDGFEYCFMFVKTGDYKFYPDNCLSKSESFWLESEKRRKNKEAAPVTNGSGMSMHKRFANDFVRPSNVITMPTDNTNHEHPATFPLSLPEFFIKLLTEPGDLVYDPFCGSGTTLVAANGLQRHYLGTEINARYCEITNERLKNAIGEMFYGL